MTDLCHNCGNCHLPSPCKEEILRCDICQNRGHVYTFCPLSVRQKAGLEFYQYWALCHNCDIWHLPEPCRYPLQVCKQCGLKGHVAAFCPVNAISRKPTADEGTAGNKRQRTDSGHVDGIGNVEMTTELAQSIKDHTLHDCLALLSNGFDTEKIKSFVGSPINLEDFLAVDTPTKGMKNPFANDALQNLSILKNVNLSQSGFTPDATPAPVNGHKTLSTISGQATEDAPGLYSIQQDRFDRGELAKSQPTGSQPASSQPTNDQATRSVYDNAFSSPRSYGNQPTNGGISNMVWPARTTNGFQGSYYGDNYTYTNGSVPTQYANINGVAGPAAHDPQRANSLMNQLLPNMNPLQSRDYLAEYGNNTSRNMANLAAAANNEVDARAARAASRAINRVTAPQNGDTANSMPSLGGHNVQPGVEDSITVGAPAKEEVEASVEDEDEPALELRKDGKPKKKQPKRKKN